MKAQMCWPKRALKRGLKRTLKTRRRLRADSPSAGTAHSLQYALLDDACFNQRFTAVIQRTHQGLHCLIVIQKDVEKGAREAKDDCIQAKRNSQRVSKKTQNSQRVVLKEPLQSASRAIKIRERFG